MKIGIATVEITPPFFMPMGGYGGPRQAGGTHDPLLLTAVHFAHQGRDAWLDVERILGGNLRRVLAACRQDREARACLVNTAVDG